VPPVIELSTRSTGLRSFLSIRRSGPRATHRLIPFRRKRTGRVVPNYRRLVTDQLRHRHVAFSVSPVPLVLLGHWPARRRRAPLFHPANHLRRRSRRPVPDGNTTTPQNAPIAAGPCSPAATLGPVTTDFERRVVPGPKPTTGYRKGSVRRPERERCRASVGRTESMSWPVSMAWVIIDAGAVGHSSSRCRQPHSVQYRIRGSTTRNYLSDRLNRVARSSMPAHGSPVGSPIEPQ
jgi:hypothetical protein